MRESTSTGRQSVNNKKNKTVFKASKNIYIFILHGLERSWQTTRWQQDGRQSWHNNTWSGPISVEKLVKQFKTHRCALNFDTTCFLQGNLYLQSNIANNRETKQIRSKQQNQQTWTTTTDRCYIPFEGKWAEGNIYISKNLHQFLYASQFFTLYYQRMKKKIYTKACVSYYVDLQVATTRRTDLAILYSTYHSKF